jgi:Zn-dependent protease
MTEFGTAVPTGGQTPAPVPSAPRSPASEVGWALASTAALLAWLSWQWGWVVALSGLIGLLIHECGHLVVINALGCGPGRIHIIPFLGGAATMKRPPRTEFHGVLIALAGPVAGLIAAAPFIAISVMMGDRRWAAGAFFIALINLLNMLPAPPLDGSKALGPALARIHPMVERAALLLVGAAAAYWALRRGSYLFGAFVAIATLGSLRRNPRPNAERLTIDQGVASVGLWLAVLALGVLVMTISLDGGGLNVLRGAIRAVTGVG